MTNAVTVSSIPRKPVDPNAGYDFWRRVGSPRHIVAPMVNQSEMTYRLLCRRYDSHLTYTPMLHSAMFVQSAKYRKEHFQVCADDRPLIAQFCGDDPLTLLSAATMIQDQCDAIDINLGCPQGIARRGHYGAFLLSELDLLKRIVSTLHDNLAIPVTCKIRVFDDETKTLELALALQASGCAMLTVHGRTKECIKDRIGPNNFDIIKKIKSTLSIPVVANGGIANFDDVRRCLDHTGCDGVMSSEAILESPTLFSASHTAPLSPLQSIAITREYLALCTSHPPPSSVIRPHLFKFLFRNLSVHTDIRDRFGKCQNHEYPAMIDELERRELAVSEAERELRYKDVVRWYSRHLTHKKWKPPTQSATVAVAVPVPSEVVTAATVDDIDHRESHALENEEQRAQAVEAAAHQSVQVTPSRKRAREQTGEGIDEDSNDRVLASPAIVASIRDDADSIGSSQAT